MKNRIRTDFFAILLLAIFLTLFFFPVLFQNKTFVTTGVVFSDLMNQNYPFKLVYSQALKEGRLPFWVAKMGDGFPLVAEGQVGAFYPFNLLFFYFLSPLLAFNLNLIFHYFLAALFTYLLGRFFLRLSPISALIAALAFSLSGFMMIHLVHISMVQTAVWLPLELWLIERVLLKPKFWQALLLGFIFTFQFLAGHPEIFYFSLFFLGAYVLLRLFFTPEKAIRQIWQPITILAVAALITSVACFPQVWESWQMIGVSNRATGFSYKETTSYLFPLRHLLTLVIPWRADFIQESIPPVGRPEMTNLWETYLYVGLIPLILAMVVVLIRFKQDPRVRFLSVIMIISLLLAFGRSSPLFKLIWSLVPGMKLFKYPTRFLLFFAFSLALLAGIGLEVFLERLKGKKTRLGWGLVLVLLVFVNLFLAQRRINPTFDTHAWFETPQSAQFLKENLGQHRFYTLGTANIDYLSTLDLEAQRGLRELLPGDFNLIYSLNSTTDQAAFFLDRHTKLSKNLPGGRLKFNQDGALSVPDELIKALSIKGVKYLLSPLPAKNRDLVKVLEISLVKEVNYLVPQMVGEQIEINKVPTQKVYLYENLQVLPRVWLVYQVRDMSGASEEEILEALVARDFDPQKEVILEEKFPGSLSGNGEGKAEIAVYKDERVEIKIESEEGGLLFFSDNFYPAWRAYVDGQETKIYLANFAFRAVPITKGKHGVEFKYQPFGFLK